MSDIAMWLFLLIIFLIGAKYKFEWVTSIRSLVTIILTLTFCNITIDGRVDPKDFLLIVSLAYNFYFLVKQRQLQNGGQI